MNPLRGGSRPEIRLFLALVSTIAACGGGDDSTTTSTGGGGTEDAGNVVGDGGPVADASSDAPLSTDAGADVDAAGPPKCTFVDGSMHPAIAAMAANLGGGQSLATSMANSGVPGLSVAVRDVDGKIYAAVFGNANNQSFDSLAPPLSPTTLFQAGSISKAVTALAYHSSMGSAALNAVDIRATVASFVVPPYAITPADLLSHAAGTAPHGFAGGYVDTDPLPTTQQIVLGESPATSPAVTFDAGKVGVFQYSGGGLILFQAWHEQLTGTPHATFVHDNLFVAAGTKRSHFIQPLTKALDHDAACGKSYNLTNAGLCRKVYPELAAAGLWTTPSELACMADHVATKRKDVLAVVTSRALAVDFDNGNYPQKMGLGLFHRPANGIDETEGHMFEHSGVNEGFLSWMVFFDDGRAIVAMDNGYAAQGGISAFSVRALCRELKWPCEGKNLAVK